MRVLLLITFLLQTLIYADDSFTNSTKICQNKKNGRYISESNIKSDKKPYRYLKATFICENNKMIQSTVYYENGKVFRKFTNKNTITYDQNGKLKKCVPLKKDACKAFQPKTTQQPKH